MKKKPTVVINFYGGPGTGKSTHAAGLFYRMKTQQINCEYIQEYAKDRTWEEDDEDEDEDGVPLEIKPERKISLAKMCQPYVTGKQFWRQFRVRNKVEAMTTDSPLLTGLLYPGWGVDSNWEKWCFSAFHKFDNINIFLERNLEGHPYNPKGRSQTQDEAIGKDGDMKKILDDNDIPYHTVKVAKVDPKTWSDEGLDEIYQLTMLHLRG